MSGLEEHASFWEPENKKNLRDLQQLRALKMHETWMTDVEKGLTWEVMFRLFGWQLSGIKHFESFEDKQLLNNCEIKVVVPNKNTNRKVQSY